jgi:dTMP kinase
MTNIIQNFAVFDVGYGSGTSTQLSLLEKRMAEKNPKPVFYPCFEPTDGPVGRLIRSALKKEIHLMPETLARLFAADRAEHLYGVDGVIERCLRGELVVSDRYALSSLVYQGIECGDDLPQSLNAGFPLPELLIFLDLESETALKRLENRPALEIYENLEFQKKVRQKYLRLLDGCREAGVRVSIIDASKSPEVVADEVWSVVSEMPIFE